VGERIPFEPTLDVIGVVKTSSGLKGVVLTSVLALSRLPGDVMKGVRGVLRGVSNASAVEIRSSSAEEDQSNSSSSCLLSSLPLLLILLGV
jgi:hypothetical protein